MTRQTPGRPPTDDELEDRAEDRANLVDDDAADRLADDEADRFYGRGT